MIPAVSGVLGSIDPTEWSVYPTASAGSPLSAAATDPTSAALDPSAATGSGSFGSMLSTAINSLEQSQATATTAAQQLATGQLNDPTQAITAVENASLAMQLASQVRTKLDEAVTTLFQTQA